MNSSIVSQEQVYKITEVVELMKDNIIFYSIDNKGRKVIYVLKNKKIKNCLFILRQFFYYYSIKLFLY